jgi:hypothetical protein
MPECASIGVQTSAARHINLMAYGLGNAGLPLYRQWTMPGESAAASECGAVCTPPDSNGVSKRGCERGTLLIGPVSNSFQTALVAEDGRYFVDLSAGLSHSQPTDCLIRADWQQANAAVNGAIENTQFKYDDSSFILTTL